MTHGDDIAAAAADATRTPVLVAVSGVSKTFRGAAAPVAAVRDASFDIPQGAFFSLLGPSGCGKTTILRMIAGFEHPDSGDIALDGRSVLAMPPHRRPVNIVFQSYALFSHLSIADNVGFGLRNRGIKGRPLAAATAAALQLVGLEDQAARKPAALSGGQQQRVALARALAPQPRLLLLDEPLSALDPGLRHDMQAELKRIQRQTGVTFLLVTHDQEEAMALSDIVAVMGGGQLRQVGPPAEVFQRPRTSFVAAFLGANVVAGSLVGAAAPLVAIRPETIAIDPTSPSGDPTDNDIATWPATVEEQTFLGARTAVSLRLADGTSLRVDRAGGAEPFPPGMTIHCRAPRADIVPLQP